MELREEFERIARKVKDEEVVMSIQKVSEASGSVELRRLSVLRSMVVVDKVTISGMDGDASVTRNVRIYDFDHA